MRAALWLVALFGIAVAVALFSGNNQAVVTLFWPPYRVDLSLNLVLLLLAGLFVVSHLAWRAFDAVYSLPLQARRWRAQQKERAMYAALMEGMAHLTAGRFIRAIRAAENALQQESSLSQLAGELGYDSGHHPERAQQLRTLAHLLAAESAQALRNRSLRDQHLQLALAPSTHRAVIETREGVQLRAARWALEDGDPAAALELLGQLPVGVSRRTLALRIRLRAARLARQTSQALETARLLAKHRAFSTQAAQSIVRGLALELLNGAHDPEQLQSAWLSLDDGERAMPELAVHAASRLVTLGGDAAQARRWLALVWDEVMQPRAAAGVGESLRVKLIGALEQDLTTIDAAWLARIEAALQTNPRDASLQYLAGMACLKRQLWGKAQQLLAHSVTSLQDPALLRRAWRALAELAAQRGDTAAVELAYRRAADV